MSYSSQTHAIICYVESHIKEEKLDYEELEQRIGFSLPHIRELFRNCTGCSLARYVRIRKIYNAAFELIHTEKSIMNIALQYGFLNHESFTRAFRKIVGVTPSEFRKVRSKVGKDELVSGVYGIGLLDEKSKGAIIVNKEQFKNDESTILYGVPRVGWGTYGGSTPFPICLKACADYLGEDVGYAYLMAATGAAFRLTWNEEEWDLGNVDIYHTFQENDEVYHLGAKVLGRKFELLGRNEKTTKEDFIQFIKKHIDQGYPCIAQGIIGPPEACLITGYRDNGNVLLGWNFFQDDPDFASQVKKDDCGYFICDDWWENTDTHSVMCLGDKCENGVSEEEILSNALRALDGRKEGSYCKGISAYDAWANMLGDDNYFSEGDNFSVLFHKILCQNDAMNCLTDGRGSASEYFAMRAEESSGEVKIKYQELAKLFAEVKKMVEQMWAFLGSWEDTDAMLANLADKEVRKTLCQYIEKAKELDKKAFAIVKELCADK